MSVISEIQGLAKELHIKSLANKRFEIFENEKLNTEFLLDCLKQEQKFRLERTTLLRIKQACLPDEKRFDMFDTESQKNVTDTQLIQLQALDWIDGIYNLIIIGSPRTGKTHIALAVGNKAVKKGYKVFSTMDNLIHIFKTQEISVRSASKIKWIKNATL